MVSINRATSWVVNALVDATPISAPARVRNDQVTLTHQRTVVDIGYHQAADKLTRRSVAQGRQRIGGFARLRNRDQQCALMLDAFAIAKLRGDFDLAGTPASSSSQ